MCYVTQWGLEGINVTQWGLEGMKCPDKNVTKVYGSTLLTLRGGGGGVGGCRTFSWNSMFIRQ